MHELQTPVHTHYTRDNYDTITQHIDRLKVDGTAKLVKGGFSEKNIICEVYLHLRYDRTGEWIDLLIDRLMYSFIDRLCPYDLGGDGRSIVEVGEHNDSW